MGEKTYLTGKTAIETWSSLFNHSSFYCLDRDLEFDSVIKEISSRFDTQEIENVHPNRKKEFLSGRVCAFKAYEQHFKKELMSLPIGADRSPQWPENVIGSISHNRNIAGAAVCGSEELLGVGIDFEVLGRTRQELSRHIKNNEDLLNHQLLSNEELLTIIFSAKESLYKALYGSTKAFFGFDAAALREIDLSIGTFRIDLIKDLTSFLGPSHRYQFHGRLKIIGENCLTVLEIPR